jgi:hypothetical protein
MQGLAAVLSIDATGKRVLNVGNMKGMRTIIRQREEARLSGVHMKKSHFSMDDLSTRVVKERAGASFIAAHFNHLESAVSAGTAVEARHALGDHFHDFHAQYAIFQRQLNDPSIVKKRSTFEDLEYKDWMCGSDGRTPLEGIPVMPLCEEFSMLNDVIILVHPQTAAIVQRSMVSSSAPFPATTPACNQISASLRSMGFETMQIEDIAAGTTEERQKLKDLCKSMHNAHRVAPYMGLRLDNGDLDAFRKKLASYCFPEPGASRNRAFPPEQTVPLPWNALHACIRTQCLTWGIISTQFSTPCMADIDLHGSHENGDFNCMHFPLIQHS